MVLGAVLDAGVPAAAIQKVFDSMGLQLELRAATVRRCGFRATHATVASPHEHHPHRHLRDILAILEKADLTSRQRRWASRIFQRLAEAEAEVHGVPVEKVHFHEVGAWDSIADIVGAVVGLDLLGIERFTASPIPTGSGTVQGDHGVMPVPAPGTLALLRGVPVAAADVASELTTPTGAAIVTTLADAYLPIPSMWIEKIGYGAGSRDFPHRPNIMRLIVGSAVTTEANYDGDTIVILETQVDDTTPQIVAYCQERLLQQGALDVYVTPILMKKSRMGMLISVLCPPERVAACEAILFAETGTYGIRRRWAERHKLRRESLTAETPWGAIRCHRGRTADGQTVLTPEYEDCAAAARRHQVPLRTVYEWIRQNVPGDGPDMATNPPPTDG